MKHGWIAGLGLAALVAYVIGALLKNIGG